MAAFFRSLTWPRLTGRIQASPYTSRWVSFHPSHPIGSDSSEVTDVKIDGDVYDVSSNTRTYGPGGYYYTMYAPSYCLVPRNFD